MKVSINGVQIDVPEDLSTIGQLLSLLDSELERVGLAIASISVDGSLKTAESLREGRDQACSSVTSVELEAVRASELRLQAFAILAGDFDALDAALSGKGGDPGTLPSAIASFSKSMQAVTGVLSADENSYLAFLIQRLAEVEAEGGSPGPEKAGEILKLVANCRVIFGERRDEIEKPTEELKRSSALFKASEERIVSIAVDMQTGRDKEAVGSMLFFVELFNKLIRLMPELRAHGLDVDAIRIGEASVDEFYTAFNDVLRQLTDGFERKDTVLIGDMAEYEIVPRMKGFFAAMEGALAGA